MKLSMIVTNGNEHEQPLRKIKQRRISQRTFFNTIYQRCTGMVEIRNFIDREFNGRNFFEITDTKGRYNFIKQQSQTIGNNCFFGVATRDGRAGTKENIVNIPALWCDVDFKDIPNEQFREKLEDFPHIASIVVESGGGQHLYWLLKKPAEKKDIATVENINRRIVHALGGDIASAEAARVLRVPRTHNYKYDPPRMVVVHSLDKVYYTLEDFKSLPELPKPEKGVTDFGPVTLDSVKHGKRNTTLARIAGKYIAQGMDEKEVLDLCLGWNFRCNPPQPMEDVLSTVNSIIETHKLNNPDNVNIKTVEPIQVKPFPEHVIAGAAGKYTKEMTAIMEAPAEFFFFTYLTCLGNALSGRIGLDSALKNDPRMYTLLLGESSTTRKSTVISKTVKIFKEALNDWNYCRGVGSAEGLQDELADNQNTLLVYDEFKAFIGKTQIRSSVLLPCVTTLFHENEYKNRTKKNTLDIPNGHLSLLAASTLETYENTWANEFTDIGFNNRLFIVPGESEKRFTIPQRLPDDIYRKMKNEISSIVRLVDDLHFYMVEMDALEILDQWYQNRKHTLFTKRLATYARRLMILLAANSQKKRIGIKIVQHSIDIVEWQLEMRRLHDPINAENKVAYMQEKIKRYLQTHGTVTQGVLTNKTGVALSGTWIFDQAINGLIKFGIVKKTAPKRKRPGPKTVHYGLIEN